MWIKGSGITRILLLVALSAALGFTQGKGKEPRSSGSELSRAPAAARTRKNPCDGQADAAAAGRKLFQHHCAGCHGTDAHGIGKAPNLHSPAIRNATPGELAWFLNNGDLRSGMPAWSRLPEQRRWQLVAFLKTLAPTRERDAMNPR